jgi:Na+/proline symporter
VIAGWILLVVSLMYVGLLFGVAWFGDRKPLYPQHNWLRPLVYSLALAVYCSSWTFYGAVGTAANDALAFLPIYLGPILLMLFAWRVLERMALVAREQNIVSIADFISSRYGRAQHLAALVSLIALVAAVPYLALQFKAVAMSVDVLIGTSSNDAGLRSVLADPALYVALMLAVFSILFGTRRIDATEHHHGMMLAIALESLVKLLVFVAIGVFAVTRLPGSGDFATRAVDSLQTFAAAELPRGFVAQTLLAFTAIICLPRQFQVAVVECEEPGDVRRARWMFTGYLLLICLMVPPITLAGQALLGASGTPGDSYVLALPMAEGFRGLALAVFIGGLSAATGMVIVASVALATMVSNDLVMPLLLRSARLRPGGQHNFGRLVLMVRRVIILLLALVAYGYHRATGGAGNLAAFGLLAFVAVAQFAPALIGALYWRGGSRAGVEAGLIGGFLVWIYTLVLPMLTRAGWLAPEWLHTGPFGLAWLRPEALFGVIGWDAITHGTFWSLLLNIGTFLVVSARYRPSFEEQMRATPFLDPYARRPPLASASWQGRVSGADLLALAGAQCPPCLRRECAGAGQGDDVDGRCRPRIGAVHRAPARRRHRRGIGAPHAHLGAARLGHGAGRSGGNARRGEPGTAFQSRAAFDHHREHSAGGQRGRSRFAPGRLEPALSGVVRISRRHALRRPRGGRSDPVQRRARRARAGRHRCPGRKAGRLSAPGFGARVRAGAAQRPGDRAARATVARWRIRQHLHRHQRIQTGGTSAARRQRNLGGARRTTHP